MATSSKNRTPYKNRVAALTFIARTRFAVLLATSFADWTKCRLATGFAVFDDAMRQVLHRDEVCLAISVAADNTCRIFINVADT